jgi:hypothetical protein
LLISIQAFALPQYPRKQIRAQAMSGEFLLWGFVKGHGFSRAERALKTTGF